MRVVLDSNILLSALISAHGPPHRIYLAWRKKRFVLLTAEVQLQELHRASRYPKFRDVLQPHLVGRMLNNLRGEAQLVEPSREAFDLADPDDVWLLGVAVAGRADHLVTGDKRAGLLARGHIGAAAILSAKAFCAMLD